MQYLVPVIHSALIFTTACTVSSCGKEQLKADETAFIPAHTLEREDSAEQFLEPPPDPLVTQSGTCFDLSAMPKEWRILDPYAGLPKDAQINLPPIEKWKSVTLAAKFNDIHLVSENLQTDETGKLYVDVEVGWSPELLETERGAWGSFSNARKSFIENFDPAIHIPTATKLGSQSVSFDTYEIGRYGSVLYAKNEDVFCRLNHWSFSDNAIADIFYASRAKCMYFSDPRTYAVEITFPERFALSIPSIITSVQDLIGKIETDCPQSTSVPNR